MKKVIRLWGIPSLLAIITLFGLVMALLGGGIWDYIGWLTLAIPIILIIKNYYK